MTDCILIVDDEALIVEVLSAMIEDMGYAVCASAATANEAVALAMQHAPRLILMDVRLKGVPDGIAVAEDIRRTVGSRVIFITGSREPDTVERIKRYAPVAVLFKPVRLDQLQSAVRQAMS